MDRKEFIKKCGFACLGTLGFSALLPEFAAGSHFAKAVSDEDQITIRKSEFFITEKEKVKNRKYVLVTTEKFNFPICVFKLNEEEYSALLMECTHKGCELQPQDEYLVCPCHGSEFSNMGVVQNPPAEQDLQTFKITSDNENIYVHI